MARLITQTNLDKHPNITFATSMQEYLSHLVLMAIQHFSFFKVNQAGERLFLTTHPDFSAYLFQQKFYEIGFHETHGQYDTGYFLLSRFNDTLAARTIGVASREKAHLDYHLMMIKKHTDYSEWFIFAPDITKTTQAEAYASYLQNMAHLERFIGHFKQSGFRLLQEAERSQYSLSHDLVSEPMFESHLIPNEMAIKAPNRAK